MNRKVISLNARIFLLCAAALLPACVATDKELDRPLEPRTGVGDGNFRESMGHILGAPFLTGNHITTLVNGNQIFTAMLNAIRNAEETITFETYVFEEGDVPRLFAEALSERARAGIKVHVLLDAQGARKSRPYHSMLRKAGAEVELYHPLLWWDVRRYNNRTHRKLLVIDGRVGFIGGVGIADEWAGNAQSPDHWRENHYRVEGPAVAHLQGAFVDNWLKSRGELLHGPKYFPKLAPKGTYAAAAFYGSPRHSSISVALMYHMAIASARRSLLIENAYFVPDDQTMEALIAAAQRGVRVQLLLPGPHIDQKAVRRAARRRYARLLRAGVEVYEYQPTMVHTKLLIADSLFVSVGSANFDNRSLRLNDEANLNVLDPKFAAEQTHLFRRDLMKSQRITLEDLRFKAAPARGAAPLEEPLANQL